MNKLITAEVLEKYSTAKTQQFYTKVKGITFAIEEEPDLMSYLANGDIVAFNAELDNKHDKFAVGLIHNDTGKRLGYIDKEFNQEIWENIVNKGNLYLARLTKTGQTEPIPGINLDCRRCYFES